MLRHTRTAWGTGRCYGRIDVPLAETAPADIAVALAALADLRPGLIWTSPARRCRALAAAVGAETRVDTRLLELDFGAWEGVHWDRVPRAALDAWAADPLGFAPPGGESGAALLARCRAFLADLPARPEMQLVVSHGGPLRLLAALAAGEPPDLLAVAPAPGALRVVPLGPAAVASRSG